MGNSTVITSLPLPLILLLALATLILVVVAALRRRSLPPETTELGLEEIIRRAEKLEILVEHDEETLKALKELEKETEEEKPPKEEKKPPKEEIPVIIVEHDEEDQGERETETIIVDHEEKKETEETPYIIVEHDEEEKDVEEPPEEEVKEEPTPHKVGSKLSLLSTEKLAKVDKDLAHPSESESPTKEVKKENVIKKRPELVKEQFNYSDLVLVPLFACLLLFYIIIPLFPKTPQTLMVGNILLFILAGYSLVVALYPKKFDAKRLVAGILIGILLIIVYQIALFSNYFTLISETISLWLLIVILIFCLITYFLRGRATIQGEKEQPKKDFEKSNITNLINEVIREREQTEKTSPVKEEEEPFLVLRSRAEPAKKVKAPPIKPIKKNPGLTEKEFSGTEKILSVILIIVLIIAISATIYIILKPK
jgi:uncharacterized membrane protein